MSDEIITFVRAAGLRQVSAGGGDSSEDIRVHRVPLRQADDWIAGRLQGGTPIDPKIFTALYWLQRERLQPSST
jgi:ADP-ribose pyrophosphatase